MLRSVQSWKLISRSTSFELQVGGDVAGIMEYKGASHLKAVDEIVGRCVEKSTTDLAAVSSTGEIIMQFNTSGMYGAAANEIGH